MNKIGKAAKILTAAGLAVVGQALKNDGIANAAHTLDPQNVLALKQRSEGISTTEEINRLIIALQLAAEAQSDVAKNIVRLLGFSESQLLQDIFVATVLGEKRNGYFVEVGVGSGKKISNTFMLEKHFDWSGILVEPNRSSHASIRNHRSAFLETRAAASEPGLKLEFLEAMEDGEHSRVANTGGHSFPDSAFKEYEVETTTLNDVLAAQSAPNKMDFLSLDTEGSEIDILKGLDLDRYSFNVLAIEHNFDSTCLSELNRILLPKGYIRVLPHISSFDAWFIHRDLCAQGFARI